MTCVVLFPCSPLTLDGIHAPSLLQVERLVAHCSRDDGEEPARASYLLTSSVSEQALNGWLHCLGLYAQACMHALCHTPNNYNIVTGRQAGGEAWPLVTILWIPYNIVMQKNSHNSNPTAFKLILTFVNVFNSLWGLLTHFQSSSFITLSMPTFSISPIIRLSLWYLSQSHCESFPIIHTHSHWKADTQFTIPEWVGGWVAVCVCRWRLWRVLPVRSLSDGIPRWQSAEMCRRRQSECHWTKHRVSATLWAGEIQHASLAHSYFLVLYMSTR